MDHEWRHMCACLIQGNGHFTLHLCVWRLQIFFTLLRISCGYYVHYVNLLLHSVAWSSLLEIARQIYVPTDRCLAFNSVVPATFDGVSSGKEIYVSLSSCNCVRRENKTLWLTELYKLLSCNYLDLWITRIFSHICK